MKEIRSNDFLVDRDMPRDVYVPFNACQMSNGRMRLNVKADQVDNQGWDMSEVAGTSQGKGKKGLLLFLMEIP